MRRLKQVRKKKTTVLMKLLKTMTQMSLRAERFFKDN